MRCVLVVGVSCARSKFPKMWECRWVKPWSRGSGWARSLPRVKLMHEDPSNNFTNSQIRTGKWQLIKRWLTDSVVLLAKRHSSHNSATPFLRPWFESHFASQAKQKRKKLTFGGSEAFQTMLFISEEMDPKNHTSFASYTAEYSPLSVRFQEMSSSTLASLHQVAYCGQHTTCPRNQRAPRTIVAESMASYLSRTTAWKLAASR
jgi:hypothetical protein